MAAGFISGALLVARDSPENPHGLLRDRMPDGALLDDRRHALRRLRALRRPLTGIARDRPEAASVVPDGKPPLQLLGVLDRVVRVVVVPPHSQRVLPLSAGRQSRRAS